MLLLKWPKLDNSASALSLAFPGKKHEIALAFYVKYDQNYGLWGWAIKNMYRFLPGTWCSWSVFWCGAFLLDKPTKRIVSHIIYLLVSCWASDPQRGVSLHAVFSTRCGRPRTSCPGVGVLEPSAVWLDPLQISLFGDLRTIWRVFKPLQCAQALCRLARTVCRVCDPLEGPSDPLRVLWLSAGCHRPPEAV